VGVEGTLPSRELPVNDTLLPIELVLGLLRELLTICPLFLRMTGATAIEAAAAAVADKEGVSCDSEYVLFASNPGIASGLGEGNTGGGVASFVNDVCVDGAFPFGRLV
jgi:hypothetical protein